MERQKRKTRVGVVVSNKMAKTVVVAIDNMISHPLLGKTIKQTKRVKAHDAENRCSVGDKVLIMETRPLSKEKNWRVVGVLEEAKKA